MLFGYVVLTAKSPCNAGGSLIASLGGHSSWVLGLAYSPTQEMFTSCGADAKVKFWDLKKREDIHSSDAHTDQVWAVAYNETGKRLASVSEDKSIIVHDTSVTLSD